MKKIIAIALASAVCAKGYSQDSTTSKWPVITGSVDGYYRYNFNDPAIQPYNSLTSFTKTNNAFALGMASLRTDKSFGKVSATIDLGFGKRAEEFAYNDANTLLAVKQMYISYAPSNAIKFTFGTWSTHVGYELVDAYLNKNYSMNYMFTNGPFTHTGLRADISLGGKNALMVGVSNPTDFRVASGMPKSLIAQFSTGSKNDKFKLYLNFVGGKQNDTKKTIQGDIVSTLAVSKKFSIGLNATLQSLKLADTVGNWNKANWWGTALYLNYDATDWFGLALRGEYINDKDEYLGLKHVFAPTLSANFKVDNLTIIPEFRLDNAGNKVFYKGTDGTTNSTGSFLIAAVYHF